MMRRQPIVPALALLLAGTAHAQNAADAYYDPQAMAAARAALKESHGNQINSLFIAERMEYSQGDDEDAFVLKRLSRQCFGQLDGGCVRGLHGMDHKGRGKG